MFLISETPETSIRRTVFLEMFLEEPCITLKDSRYPVPENYVPCRDEPYEQTDGNEPANTLKT